MGDKSIRFTQAEQYVFLFENAQLLMTVWERDHHRELYLIREEHDDHLVVDYPGDLFAERVMNVVDYVFFIHVKEPSREARYVLGCYFPVGDRVYGAYYPRDPDESSPSELIFFEITEQGGGLGLEELDDARYEKVKAAFIESYGHHLDIQLN